MRLRLANRLKAGALEFERLLIARRAGEAAADRRYLGIIDDGQMPNLNSLSGVDDDFPGQDVAPTGKSNFFAAPATRAPRDQFTVAHGQIREFAGVLLGFGLRHGPSGSDGQDLHFIDPEFEGTRRGVLHQNLTDLHATTVSDLPANFAAMRLKPNTFNHLDAATLEDHSSLTLATSGAADPVTITSIKQTFDLATTTSPGRVGIGLSRFGQRRPQRVRDTTGQQKWQDHEKKTIPQRPNGGVEETPVGAPNEQIHAEAEVYQ